ncbi:MAG: DedA family protein [Planctomycetes bacterium]|nr:DedA family protein [Planctomycetota bacterium]
MHESTWDWILREFPRLFTQLDVFLTDLVRDFGVWTYLILFLIIFCETGLVVMPFLPGDSLLFAAGAVCAVEHSPVQAGWMALVLFCAAVLGDSVNYGVGRLVGPAAFDRKIRFLNPKNLERTREFFRRHGGKAIILARFAPIIRTCTPFVAGVGSMNYRRFLAMSVLGSVLWIGLFVFAGWGFGNLPFIKANFSKVVLTIILISLLPIALEWWKIRRTKAVRKT